MNNLLCVIPARGGSKGIPGKNTKIINDSPLIYYSIRQAIDAKIPHENIILSSDSDEILDYGYQFGISALKRPNEISGDKSSTEQTLLHAVDSFPGFQNLLLLQATSPIRFKTTINDFVSFFLKGSYDSALTTTKFYDFFWFYDENSNLKSSYDPQKRPMRQDLKKNQDKMFDNGNMYITKIDALVNTKCRLSGNIGVYNIRELEGMQIDTKDDFELIDLVLSGISKVLA